MIPTTSLPGGKLLPLNYGTTVIAYEMLTEHAKLVSRVNHHLL